VNVRSIVLTLALCLVAAAVCLAATDPNMGTWKLNEAKSKLVPSMGKNVTVAYTAEGDNIKCTVDGVDAAGKPTHNEWVGKFDGKDYAVTGDPNSDMRSYTKVNDHTMNLTVKKGGKVTMEGQIVLAKDGKSRMLTIHATDEKGAKITSTASYDKQ